MEEKRLARKIKMLSHQMRRKFEKDLSERGIEVPSTQGMIIGFLYRESFKRDVFQKDIEEEFDIRRSSVTNVLQLMEKNGYIGRISVVKDARLKKIILTEKGLGVQEEIAKGLEEIECSLKKVYSPQELDQLFYLLDKLIHNLSE